MYVGKGSYQVIPVLEKAMFAEGDFVIATCDDEIYVGRVEYVMTTGASGIPGSEYYLETSPEKPALVIRTLEFESDNQYWCETPYSISVAAVEATKIAPLPLELDAEVVQVDGEVSVQMEDMSMEMMGKADYTMPNGADEVGCTPDSPDCKSDMCKVCSMKKSESEPEDDMNKACWEGYVQRGMKPKDGKMVPNCVPVAKADDLFEDSDDVVYDTDSLAKAEGYSPPAGARSAARKAIKFKEDGKANGAGTSVGWTRAGQLARGESLSLSTVKRMYSYFSRHEVDKKGKDWANQANPSNGYIMWLAWGGDAGFSWSRGIVQREMDKALFSGFGKDFSKTVPMENIFKGVGIGSAVSWNSSGGRAEGKVTRIIRSGTYNVPGTSVSVNATEDDPVAVIRLYRDGKPTDTIVAHKVKTLKAK